MRSALTMLGIIIGVAAVLSYDSDWTDTELIDTGEPVNDGLNQGFELAVSAETVYVGKRDGKLFQSLDVGKNWKDVTPILPLRFKHFNEIVFSGSTLYVATDAGVLASQSREHWRVLTDRDGTRVVIDKFAIDNITVYGAGDAGVYRLDDREYWQLISPSVPDKFFSFLLINDNLYITTQRRGIFHIPIDEISN